MTANERGMRAVAEGLKAVRAATSELGTQLRKLAEVRRGLRERTVAICAGST